MRKRLYHESRKTPLHLGIGERISVPTAVAKFGKEAPFPPRSRVERGYNLLRWTTFPGGGHFAAMEEPEKLRRTYGNSRGNSGAAVRVAVVDWMEKGQR